MPLCRHNILLHAYNHILTFRPTKLAIYSAPVVRSNFGNFGIQDPLYPLGYASGRVGIVVARRRAVIDYCSFTDEVISREQTQNWYTTLTAKSRSCSYGGRGKFWDTQRNCHVYEQ